MHQNHSLAPCRELGLRIGSFESILHRQALRHSRIAAVSVTLLSILLPFLAHLIWTGVGVFVSKANSASVGYDSRNLVDWIFGLVGLFSAVGGGLWLVVEISFLEDRIPSPLYTLITYTLRVYTSWVSAEVKCLRPARHFEEGSAYLDSLFQRVDALKMSVEQLPLSELARDRFLYLLGNLRDKRGSVASEVSFIDPRVERQQRLWCSFAEPQRVTWGDLMAFEAIVERAEQLLERPVRAWAAGEDVKKLVRVESTGLRLVDPMEVQLTSDWAATQLDYGASLPDAVKLVSVFEQLEGSKSGLRRLHRRANRLFRSRPARRMALATPRFSAR